MSQAKIYVGNLPYSTQESDLEDFFGSCGSIAEVKLIKDYQTGRSKGFAFITFESDDSVAEAVKLNGTEMDGRTIKVSEAKEDQRRGGGGHRGDRSRY